MSNYRITDTPRRVSLYYSQQTDKIPPGMPKRERQIRFRVTACLIVGMIIVYAIMTAWIFVLEPAIIDVTDQWH